MNVFLKYGLLAFTCMTFCACGSSEEIPRPSALIHDDRRSLPVLYLTETSSNEVIAAGNQPLFVDEGTGEICYRAYYCTAPSCPNHDRQEGERPALFIHRNPTAYVSADGEVAFRDVKSSAEFQRLCRKYGAFLAPTCPACRELRDVANESPPEQQQYIGWVQPYVLPESQQRMKELDQEHRQRLAHMKVRSQRMPDDIPATATD